MNGGFQKTCPHPGTCGCDFIWKKSHYKCNQVKDLEVRSSGLYRWVLNPRTSVLIRDTEEDSPVKRELCLPLLLGCELTKDRDWFLFTVAQLGPL